MLSSRPIGLPTDGALFPAKTPGKNLKNRAENIHAGMVSMTVNGKGKNAPKTPFHPSSVQGHRLFKDQKTVLTTVSRPLGDKTPMPNRIGVVLFKTPLPGGQKLSKLRDELGQENKDSPGSAQRPSSMRKHIKHPRFSGKALETPANVGKHWDISDGDIVIEAQPVQQEAVLEQDDDLDEIEYGPPNTLDIPFEPYFGFDPPNYTEVGKSLFDLAHSHHYEEVAPPPEVEIPASEFDNTQWDMIPLPEITSDDPFFLARLEDKPKPVPGIRSKAVNKLGTHSSLSVKPRSQSSLATVNSSLHENKAKTTSNNLGRLLRQPMSKTLKPAGSATTTTTTTSFRRAATSKSTKPPPIASTSTVRRPHTSLAATRPVRSQRNIPGADAVADGLLLIKHTETNTFENELDFKFEI